MSITIEVLVERLKKVDRVVGARATEHGDIQVEFDVPKNDLAWSLPDDLKRVLKFAYVNTANNNIVFLMWSRKFGQYAETF